MKVLVVEDSLVFRDSLVTVFSMLLGHEVVGTADNGEDALRLVGEHHPELVTIDGRLVNDERGLDVASKIRKVDRDILIVMVTGDPGVKFEGRGICKGALAHQDFETLLAAQLAL